MPGLDFWADYFRTMFVPQIDACADSLSTRVLPAFGNLAEEAKRIDLEEYRRLGPAAGNGAQRRIRATYRQSETI